MTLDGKTAFVSGSGHNIGRAIVLEFAGRGANVVVNGLSDPDSAEKVADEARSLGVGAIVAMGNVGDNAAVKEMAASSSGQAAAGHASSSAMGVTNELNASHSVAAGYMMLRLVAVGISLSFLYLSK